jgi:subtilase family serine protease
MTESTGIQPGKVHSYTLEWKPKSTGNQFVRLEVDPGDMVAESDETNNHYEQQSITVSESGSSVPGLGALMAVAAVIVVSLALLGRKER